MNSCFLRILLITFIFFCSCKQKKATPIPPVAVNFYSVKTQPALYYDEYPATIEALNQVSLMAQVQGYITGIFFDEGSFVKKGKKLYEIDKRLYEDNYNAAMANLKADQHNLQKAQQDADRYTYLIKENAIAKELYDSSVINLQIAKDQVKSASDSLETAKTNLDFSVVVAPFDGTIGFSQVKLGNIVTVGQTILDTISSDAPIAVDFLVNEKQLEEFENLQENENNDDSLFTIILPDNTIYPYTGKISVIDRAVDQQTGTIRIRLVFPNPQNNLRPGMSCTLRVHRQKPTPQLLIPSKAILEQMGEFFVFVVKDTVVNDSGNTNQKNNTDTVKPRLMAFEQKIIPGQTIGQNVIIMQGINAGDKIITDGIQLLHDGSPVTENKKN